MTEVEIFELILGIREIRLDRVVSPDCPTSKETGKEPRF